MSIAQKGQDLIKGQTWLPRFWRKSESLLLADRGESLDDSSAGLNASPSLDDSGHDLVVEPPKLAKPKVHNLACVDPRAKLADGVEIGPFCVVGPDVRLGRGTKLLNNVTVLGNTTLGANNLLFPNSVIGAQPQDKKYAGEETRLEVGDNNHFRENVTVHTGTAKGGGLTRVGSGNLLMVNVHLGHDVFLGDNCVFANNVMVAGHVHIGNGVVLSGAAGIHHFVTVGDYVYAGGQCQMSHDVPPFVKVDDANKIRGVNSVGLRRNGFGPGDVNAVEQIVWRLFLDRDRAPMNATLRKFRSGDFVELSNNPHVVRVVEFLERRNLGRHGRYLESLRAG